MRPSVWFSGATKRKAPSPPRLVTLRSLFSTPPANTAPQLTAFFSVLAYQVPANKSVVKVGGKYPAQQYEIGSAEALVEKALAVDVDAIKKVRDLINSDAAHLIELQMFLKATPICAWGECLGQQGMGLKKWKDL